MKYIDWRNKVLERDGHRCQDCGNTDDLHAHHILRKSQHPDKACDVDNGVTLCKDCHADRHEGDLPLALLEGLRANKFSSGKRRRRSKQTTEPTEAPCPQEDGEFRDLMIESGLTKEDLAERFGIHPHTIYRWYKSMPPFYAIAYLRLYVRVKNIAE